MFFTLYSPVGSAELNPGHGHQIVAYPSSQGNKWRLKLVQFNGLFNNQRTLSYTSTNHRLGINPNENALKPQLIQSQLHIIQVH